MGVGPHKFSSRRFFIGALAPVHLAGIVSAAAVVGIAVLGIMAMFVTSWLLSRTVLRGEATSFSLELPPYRPPRILQTLYTSVIDRTLIVLWRAIVFAIPAGAVIWLVSNIYMGDASLAEHAVSWLNPFGIFIGLNGVIILAYVVAIPANEIVIPTVLMLTVLTADIAGAGSGAGCHVRARQRRRDGTAAPRGRVDAADRCEPDAVQPLAQPLFYHHLYDLQGDTERKMDNAGRPATGRRGCHSLLPRDPGVEACRVISGRSQESAESRSPCRGASDARPPRSHSVVRRR